MPKIKTKKIVSIFLAVIMMCLCVVPGIAKAADKTTPVLLIAGFTEYALVDANGDGAFPPSNDKIIDTVKNALTPLGLLLQKDYKGFCDGAIPVVNNLLAPIACNPDGTIKDNTVKLADQFTEPVSAYGIDKVTEEEVFDRALVNSVVDKVGAENVYLYGLDWRKSMSELASDINDYVTKIKTDKGVDKVSIAGHSMGGAVLSTYIATYGYDSLSNITMVNSAFNGLEMLGQLFSGNIKIDSAALLDLITENIGNDVLSKILGATQILNSAIPLVEDFLAAENEDGGTYKDTLFSQCIVPSFGYIPGIWSLVPDKDYETAKAYMKAHMIENQTLDGVSSDKIAADWAIFEEKIDSYHNIQVNTGELLKEAKADGVTVTVLSNYNLTIAPVTPAANLTSDGVIETVYTSGGAICADKGKTLGDGYKQAALSGENHLSADNIIDASTCLFPENTWFIKNCQHSNFDYTENACDIYVKLITAETQPTVNTWRDYPQFMVYNSKTHILSPLDSSLGDVDFDGLITPVDSRMILRDAAKVELLENPAKAFSDFDSDGNTTETDARLVLECFAGL